MANNTAASCRRQETHNEHHQLTCGKFLNDCFSEISVVMTPTVKSVCLPLGVQMFQYVNQWLHYNHTPSKMLTQNLPTLPKGCRGDKLMWTPYPLD